MKHLSDITKFIKVLLRSQKTHILVVIGAPGWAKTYTLRETLKALGVSYEMLGAYSTPLALYNRMADLSGYGGDGNGAGDRPEVLVLDDTAGVLTNGQALSILNAASWPGGDADGRRRVTWTSTTEKAVADSFVFTGKLILLSNHMPDLPQARAFVNRALYYPIEIEADLVEELLCEAARSKAHFDDTDIALVVAKFLGEQAHHYEPGRISLRDLERGYEFAQIDPDGWQSLILKTLPKRNGKRESPDDVVIELNTSGKRVGEQLQDFTKRTGLGRRRFFYLREQHGLSSESKSRAAKGAARTRAKPGKVAAATKKRPKADLDRVKNRAKKTPEVQYVAEID